MQPLIELRNISRVYRSGEINVMALDGIDLTIYPGEFIAIMGTSGSGKTTLMNILGCLDKPTAGSYLFLGRDVSGFDSDELARLRREEFGFIFQSYNLIRTASALENVEVPSVYAGVPAAERHARALQLLNDFGLGNRCGHRPNQLSGGQQQRVSAARALMNGGRLILADEPTGALDSRSGEELMAILKELSSKGHTIILITHEREVAEYADRIIEIRDGHITADPGSQKWREGELEGSFIGSADESYLGELGEAGKTAYRALRSNIFRTILTLLGIVIGVASVISMLAIGDGAKQAVVDRISAMGSNLVNIRPGAPNMRGRSDVATLVPADVTAINELDNVIAAVPEQESSVTVRYSGSDKRTSMNSTSHAYLTARQLKMASGVFFTEDDERSYATVAVLGKTVVEALFPFEDPIGKLILVNNIPFQVIGVVKSLGAGFGGRDQDDILFVPYSTGSLRISGQNYLRNVTVAVENTDIINDTQEAIRSLLIQRHGVEDFQIRNMTSIIESVSETQNTMTILLGSIAAISLLVGGIGVMNIMLVSVTERTREIGIRMAAGARMRNIMQQFLIEALVVSALGGVIGVIGGLGVATLLQMYGTPIKFAVLPVVGAFACSFATGLIFGYLPARKAARLDPVAALASE